MPTTANWFQLGREFDPGIRFDIGVLGWNNLASASVLREHNLASAWFKVESYLCETVA